MYRTSDNKPKEYCCDPFVDGCTNESDGTLDGQPMCEECAAYVCYCDGGPAHWEAELKRESIGCLVCIAIAVAVLTFGIVWEVWFQ